jgi:hypothetical protein
MAARPGDRSARLALDHLAETAGVVQQVYVGQKHPEALLLQVTAAGAAADEPRPPSLRA